MASLKTALLCCRLNFLKWSRNPKIFMLMLIVVSVVGIQAGRYADAVEQYGMKLTVWIFPYLFFPTMILLYVFILIVLFGNSPFLDHQSISVLSRANRRSWLLGQIFYTVLASALLMLFAMAVLILRLLPCADFSNEWSMFLKGLVAGNVSASVMMGMNKTLFSMYSPIVGLLLCCLIHWLLNSFLGALCMFLNLFFHTGAGNIAVAVLAVFSYLIEIFPPFQSVFYLSPISWYNVGNIRFGTAAGSAPGVGYVLGFLILGNLFLYAASVSLFSSVDLYALDKEGTI